MDNDYAYTFEFPDRSEPLRRIMRLTRKEFNLLVIEGMPLHQSRKALAYVEFRWLGERIKRIPNTTEQEE